MITYRTKDGDVLDWIVWKHYGTTAVLEDVLKENPNATDERLKAGVEIKLPYIDVTQKTNTEVRLWN